MVKRLNNILLLDADQKRWNAGPKARLDTARFLAAVGFEVKKIPTSRSRYWRSLYALLLSKFRLLQFRQDDLLWFQFPLKSTTMVVFEKAILEKIPTVAFIHDLEGLKRSPLDWSLIEWEIQQLKKFTYVISLNNEFTSILRRYDIQPSACLHLWDYFCTEYSQLLPVTQIRKRILFAGNLSVEKSEFINHLGQISSLDFEIYGGGLDVQRKLPTNVRYMGSFQPDCPPFSPDGAIGLVWDGASISTCEGAFGSYLAYNTPHKASMYLSRDIPVAVWSGACIASLIQENHAGLVFSSISEMAEIVNSLTNADYQKLVMGARRLGEKIRNGYHIKTAVGDVLTCCLRAESQLEF